MFAVSDILFRNIPTALYIFLHIAFLPNHFFSTYTSWNSFEHIFSHIVNCTPSGKNVKSLSHALNGWLNMATLTGKWNKVSTVLWYNHVNIDPAYCQIFQKFFEKEFYWDEKKMQWETAAVFIYPGLFLTLVGFVWHKLSDSLIYEYIYPNQWRHWSAKPSAQLMLSYIS